MFHADDSILRHCAVSLAEADRPSRGACSL